MTIKKLPQSVIDHIAAGQVVERPASIVKELLENALDAGASSIEIFLKQGGLEEIKVIDNGVGMSQEDVLESLKSHTTSKVFSIEDLNSIATYGFRGEALASIAKVSELSVASRVKGSTVGYELKTAHGVQKSFSQIGMPLGTIITVSHLFSKIPARKKFLKTPQYEFSLCLEEILKLALISSHVRFVVRHNGKEVMFASSDQSEKERLMAMLSLSNDEPLIRINHQSPYYQMKGYILKPSFARGNRKSQYLYINKRYVYSEQVSGTIKKAYGSLLEPKMFPSFILSLEMNPSLVDVNVHPRKERVLFSDESGLLEEVEKAIKTTLQTKDITHYHEHILVADKGMDEYSAEVLRDATIPWQVKKTSYQEKEILQMHDTFLVYESSDGIVLVDQHAAHERILYEQFLETFQKQQKKSDSITLDEPKKLVLTLQDSLTLQEHVADFQKLGFMLICDDKGSWQIFAYPSFYKERNIQELILEVLDELQTYGVHSVDRNTNATIAYLACRTAIKAGDRLSIDERKALLQKLQKTKTQYTCPHGRPVYVVLTLRQLHKMFKRIK